MVYLFSLKAFDIIDSEVLDFWLFTELSTLEFFWLSV